MNRVPFLWSAAYGPRRSPVTRYAARTALKLKAFVQDLARADHTPFASH
ncbi:hypothetical protein ACGFNU_18855 [Spirillospora sp. NPDC048911]